MQTLAQQNQPPNASDVRSNVYLSDFPTTTLHLPNTNITVVEVAQPNSVYCPLGSSVPLLVRMGYYSAGNNRTTRYLQQPCPMGSYCVQG